MSLAGEQAARATLQGVLASEQCDFYRTYYADELELVEGVATGRGDWSVLPFIDRSVVHEALGAGCRYAADDDINSIRVTSGTSGRGVMVVPRAFESFDLTDEQHRAVYLRNAIKRLVTFSSAQGRLVESFHDLSGIRVMGLDPSDIPGSHTIVSAFKPDMLAGFVYSIVALLPLLDDETASHIKAVQLFGEKPSVMQWTMIKERLAHAELFSEYACIEAQSSLGSGCKTLIDANLPYVHPYLAYMYFEVIDPKTGAVLSDYGASGEMVLTHIRPAAFPLIRYRTGDLVTIMEPLCDCQKPTYRIEGRLETAAVRIRGGEIKLDEIERVLHALASKLRHSDFAVFLGEAEEGGEIIPELTLELDWDEQQHAADDLSQLISAELRVAPNCTYVEGVEQYGYRPLKIRKIQHTNRGKQKGIQKVTA